MGVRKRPVPGTVVRARVDGAVRYGVVMYYEMQWNGYTFPVKFDDGVWRMMSPRDVEEIPRGESRAIKS